MSTVFLYNEDMNYLKFRYYDIKYLIAPLLNIDFEPIITKCLYRLYKTLCSLKVRRSLCISRRLL